MMIKLNAAVSKIFIALLVAPLVAASNIYEERPKGFLWYTDDLVLKQQDQLQVSSKNSTTAAEAKSRNQQLSQKLDDAIQVMLDRPTVENAIKAQWLQKQVIERSEQVSKSWVLAALLDAGLLKFEDNQNVLHRELQKDSKAFNMTKQLKNVANDWGILFYWREGCIYCQRFIPIVHELQIKYGFKIMAVSEHGGDYGFWVGQKDTGLIANLNPYGEAPLLFLLHKDGKEIYPIARGITDLDQIAENILMVVKHSKEISK